MSNVTSKIDGIISANEWAKPYAELDDTTKYKKIAGVDWVDENTLNDPAQEARLLWMIPAGAGRNGNTNAVETPEETPAPTVTTPDTLETGEDTTYAGEDTTYAGEDEVQTESEG